MKKVNISRIAEAAGVSKATVSNYLNRKSGKLSQETFKKIEGIIKELNYIPHFGARRLIPRGDTKTVGIIMEDASLKSVFTIDFYGLASAGIHATFGTHGYRVIIIPSIHTDTNENTEYLKELSRGFVDGYLLFNIRENDLYIRTFSDYHIPFVCLGYIRSGRIRNYVGTNYLKGIYDAVMHFFSHGIKRIGISIGQEDSIVGKQIRDGYTRAFRDKGIKVNQTYIISGIRDMDESAFDAFRAMFSRGSIPEACILSKNHYRDLAAAAEVCNIRLFSDIKIILFGNVPEINDKRIAYLDVPLFDIGKLAAEKLVSLMNGETIYPELFPMKLITAESCGCV